MKKMYSSLLAGSLIFCTLQVAKAQPPDPPQPQIPRIQEHVPRTPAQTIRGFVRDDGTSETYFSDYVEGYDPRNPINSEISKIIKHDLGNFVLAAKDITIVPDPQNKDLATANYSLGFSDAMLGLRFAQKDSVQLKRLPF